MRKLLLCLVMLSMVVMLSAQSFTTYTSENSDLPVNMVYCIDFDNDGNIWFGGQKDPATGIANVSMLSGDLSTWTIYEQSDLGLDNMEDRVFYIAVDDQNTKWFCTHYGVSGLKTDGTSFEVDFTVDDYTRSVETDSKGNVYLSNRTDEGIWVTEDHGENWEMWTAADIGLSEGRPEIYDLREDSQGRLWICTWYGIVYRDTDGTWHEIEDLAGYYTYAMTMDKNDVAWTPDASTNDLYKIASDGSTTKLDSTDIAPLRADIYDLEADKNGNIWCATNGEGLVQILPDGSFNQYTLANTDGGILQDTLTHLEINDDVIWVSTASEGIVRIDDMIQDEVVETELAYEIYNTENSDLPVNMVYCIDFDNDDNIWFGGQKDPGTGIANVSMLTSDLSIWNIYEQSDLGLDNMEDRVFYIAVDDQNTKWFCTHYGVSGLKTDGTSFEVDFTVDDYTRSVETDSKGNVYLSNRTDEGIWVTEDHGENWEMWTAADIGLSEGRPEIYDLREDSQGRLWICTWYGIVYRDTDGTWHEIEDLAGYYTYAMTMDKNDVAWTPDASTNDLYKIASDGSTTKLDSTDIAPLRADIYDLEADKNGNIWCATNGEGLLQILPDGSFNQYTVATTDGGIPQDTLTHLEINDDEMWVSTVSEGLVRITGFAAPTAIDDEESDVFTPQTFVLHQNYPNPFNPETNIRFDVAKSAKVQLNIYNLRGELVKQLTNRNYQPGTYRLLWDGTNNAGNQVVSGIYFYQLRTGSETQTRKMMFVQ
ncbi:MAG: two-component regulator propeller domain-containing protein [Fidelibacterota bacterium]